MLALGLGVIVLAACGLLTMWIITILTQLISGRDSMGHRLSTTDKVNFFLLALVPAGLILVLISLVQLVEFK